MNKWFIIAPVLLLLALGFFYRWLLQYHGLTVTSHWRTPANNMVNDGKPLSLHLIGMAWDIRTWDHAPGTLNAKLRAFLKWIPWARVVPESDHIHIQFL